MRLELINAERAIGEDINKHMPTQEEEKQATNNNTDKHATISTARGQRINAGQDNGRLFRSVH